MYVILDFHGVPQSQNAAEHSADTNGGNEGYGGFWEDNNAQGDGNGGVFNDDHMNEDPNSPDFGKKEGVQKMVRLTTL